MNPQLQKLYTIAKKPSRTIVGLMSGTSLDGLDIALCRFTGAGKETRCELLDFVSFGYEQPFVQLIQSVFAKRTVDQQLLSGLHAHIGTVHAKLVNKAIDVWGIAGADIDLVASHGQTVYHAPQHFTGNKNLPNSTLQIGDGDHIAVRTGMITVSDFRQKHVAAGGEGAPLVVYGDQLLFRASEENRILLNIGGIANFTFLPRTSSQAALFATDTGPGNTLMNQYMQKFYGKEMDEDAKIAGEGRPNRSLVDRLLQHPFMQLSFPKTTGPESFNLTYLDQVMEQHDFGGLSHEDIMASLCLFSAKSIADAIQKSISVLDETSLYLSGGGLHNPLLVRMLRSLLPKLRIHPFDVLGIDPDAKEAVLFAALANETVAGRVEHVQGIAGAPAVCMGKISFPY